MTEPLGEGIKATITLPESADLASAGKTIHFAFQEGRQVFRALDKESAGEVAKINKNAGKKDFIQVGDDLLRLFRVCMQVYEWTGGLFDVVKAKPGTKIKDPQLQVSFEKKQARLENEKTYLDFQGILKGYVIDRMAGILKGNGYTDFMIQTGNDYRTMGKNGRDYWRIAIPDPEGQGQMLCRVSLETASIATADVRDVSGARSRVGTHMPAKTDLKSVTVITKNATNATALAATALLAGKAKAREFLSQISSEGFGAILEDQSGKITTIGDVTAACFEG